MLLQLAAERIAPHLPEAGVEIAEWLEYPPKPEMGDVSLPCFVLAKRLKRSPQSIAAETAGKLNEADGGIRAEATGGYLNLRFEPSVWSARLLRRIADDKFGQPDWGKGRTVVIDMSSPNIAKPFGVGHLRSTVIGNALGNLYRAAGYRVIRVNHLGDWGTQFGKLIAAYKRWGNDEALAAEPIRESLRLYVKFHDESERSPELADEGREWFRRLEAGDDEARQLWDTFVRASMKEFDRVYERLGIRFDHVLGESFYNDKIGAVVERLAEQSLLEESDGAQVVRLAEEGLPPCLILKSDGATIYPARDLATAIYRKETMGADRLLYVVGAEQTLHFKQVFAVLARMGCTWSEACRHVPFGLMRMNGKKMSTRRGQVVFLEEVLDEAVARAERMIADKNPELPNRKEVAEVIGVGAVVFGDLKHRRMLEIDFNLEEAISFDGETGPYLQYTFARASSLLRKGRDDVPDRADNIDGVHLSSPEAWMCVKMLCGYEEALAEALRDDEPSVMARYLLDLAKAFNRFYHAERIVADSRSERRAKLTLVSLAARKLQSGMALLGLRTPERM